MRLIALDRMPDGMELARDVRSGLPGDVPLLRHGTRIERRYRDRLREKGVRAVWVQDALSEGIDPLPPLEEEMRIDAERRVTSVMAEASQALQRGKGLAGASVSAIGDVARLIAVQVAELPEAVYALSDLSIADAYTHRHSVQVAVVGLLLAERHWRRWGWVDYQGRRRYDRRDDRLAKLGFGLLVHDLGKLGIPLEVLHKPGPLDDEEWALMRRHPEMGVAMLEPAGTSPLALDVVRSHHERLDGSGYPRGVAGDQVHEFARIAALADTYDAITSDRIYQPGRPPHVALNIVAADAPQRFDARLLDTFVRVAVPFPVGTEVPLEDGGVGVVADADVLDPWCPIVRRPDGEEARVDLTHLDERRTSAGAAQPAAPAVA